MEIPQELAEKVYKLIESVKVDGKLRKGANEVTKSIEKGEAKLAVIAGDVTPKEIIFHFPALAKEREIPLVTVSSKAELGAAAGLPVGTAAVSIVDSGEARKSLSLILKSIETLKKKAKASEEKETKTEPSKEESKKEEEKPKESEEKKQEKPKEESKPEAKEEKKEEAKPKPEEKKKPKVEDSSKEEEKPSEEKKQDSPEKETKKQE